MPETASQSPGLDKLAQSVEETVGQLELSEHASAYGYFSTQFYERCQAEKGSQSLPFLELAIIYGRKAIETTRSGDYSLAIRLDRQSSFFVNKYTLLLWKEEYDDRILQDAVELGRQAVKVATDTDEDKEDRADFCGNLSDTLLKMYRKNGDHDWLDEALLYAGEASQRHDGANNPNHLNTLANVCFEKHISNPSQKVLTRAVTATRAALALDASRAGFWYTSSIIQQRQYNDSGQDEFLKLAIDDCAKATELAEMGVRTGQEPRSIQVTIINHMGSLLADRYKRYGHLADLREAVKLGRSVFDELKSDVPIFLRSSQVLSNALAQLYERGGQLEHLKEAINISEAALESPSFAASRVDQAMHYNNLSLRTLAYYQHTNTRASIKAAIEYAMEAIRLAKNTTEQARYSVSLAGAYSARSEMHGSVADIDEAIQLLTTALERLPFDDKWRALDFLSSFLSQKFRRYAGQGDEAQELLRSAISHRQAVLESLPAGFPMVSDVLLRSSYLQAMLYSSTAAADDSNSLSNGIAMAKKALECLPEDHPANANASRQLAELYGLQYELTSDVTSLERAIAFTKQAEELVDERHAYFAAIMNTCGTLLVHQWGSSDRPQDEALLQHAKEKFLKALRNPHSLPTERIRGGKAAGLLSASLLNWDDAANIFQETLSLASGLAPRQLSREDQQFYLQTLSELSAAAASAALESGRSAEDALALLEAGRGLLFQVSLDLQINLERLECTNLGLFYKYSDIQNKLRSLHAASTTATTLATGSPGSASDENSPMLPQPTTASNRISLVEELETLEAVIRESVPGLGDFGLPGRSTSPGCLISSENHAIVAFNVTGSRCDAFIITHNGPVRNKRLHGLNSAVAREAAASFVGPNRLTFGPLSTFHERNAKLREHLGWLWNEAVKPVLADLGFFITKGSGKSNSPLMLPRVTWVTSGPLGLLPLHASGTCWDDGSSENTACHVISSYTPTLSTLYASQTKSQELNPSSFGEALMLTMPKTTGYSDLSIEEVESVKASLSAEGMGEAPKFESRQFPSKKFVLDRLDRISTVFFGCHGESDVVNPSNSALLLADGEDGLPERLTIGDISQLLLRPAFLAYLSACSTAENTTAAGLMDEAIHLASTLLSVGFPHVVASLWDADDEAAGHVAQHFFSGLAEQIKRAKTNGIKPTFDIPLALHQAVAVLREGRAGGGRRKRNASKNVIVWAPFIHLGCSISLHTVV